MNNNKNKNKYRHNKYWAFSGPTQPGDTTWFNSKKKKTHLPVVAPPPPSPFDQVDGKEATRIYKKLMDGFWLLVDGDIKTKKK